MFARRHIRLYFAYSIPYNSLHHLNHRRDTHLMIGVAEINDKDRIILWILGIAAFAAVIFDFLKLLPLFNAFFIRDDYQFLDLGAFMRQQDPLAFLTATCVNWWRPIALLIPALVYLVFGLTPLPFHIVAYIIHIFSGLMLILLCRKMFDLKVGLIAFTIYIASPISFSNVGWMLGAMEDETATFFYFIALLTQIRTKDTDSKRPYFLPVIMIVLGSFCKITWLGMIPSLLFMDWANYPNSKLVERTKRFLPFFIFLLPVAFNIFIAGSYSSNIYLNYNSNFNMRNFIEGAFLSFIPSNVSYYITNWYQILIIIPIMFFLLALGFSKIKRRVVAIGIAYLGMLTILGFSQIQKDPLGWIMGWRHLTPLVGFAAILIAVTLTGLDGKLHLRYVGWLISIILVGILIWVGLPMKNDLQEEVQRIAQHYRLMTRSFIVLCRSLPNGTEIVIVGKKPFPVCLLADLAGDHRLSMLYTKRRNLEFIHNYYLRSKLIILETKENMGVILDGLLLRADIRLISTDEAGVWVDITEYGKEECERLLKSSP